MAKKKVSNEQIIQKYIKEKLSIRQTAKSLKVGHRTIWERLYRMKIKIRPKGIGLSDTRKKFFKEGKLHNWTEGKTKESDPRIAKAAKKNSIWQKLHSTGWEPVRKNLINGRSKYEFILEKAFRENGIKDFEVSYVVSTGNKKNLHNGIPYKYILDFAFPKIKLNIEVDGTVHKKPLVKESDNRRDNFFKSHGWKIVRFQNNDIIHCIPSIIKLVNNHIQCDALLLQNP